MPFDKTKSQITENKKIQFLQADWGTPLGYEPATDSAPAKTGVPGLGPKTAEALRAKGITNLYQLAGVFLTFRADAVDEEAWCEKMWNYLTTIGCPGGHKAGIIDCLGEKLALAFPGIYTPQ